MSDNLRTPTSPSTLERCRAISGVATCRMRPRQDERQPLGIARASYESVRRSVPMCHGRRDCIGGLSAFTISNPLRALLPIHPRKRERSGEACEKREQTPTRAEATKISSKYQMAGCAAPAKTGYSTLKTPASAVGPALRDPSGCPQAQRAPGRDPCCAGLDGRRRDRRLRRCR
jgi:hypothetical protein